MPSTIPISPANLYWGTPVVLITTTNPDGSTNISAISSAFWLSNRCILGIAGSSQTPQNTARTGQCTLNLPSDNMGGVVNALAKTTGTPVLPPWKAAAGYRFVADKFAEAGLRRIESELVQSPRIRECPVQMECRVMEGRWIMMDRDDVMKGRLMVFEVEVLRTYVAQELRMEGYVNRVDPDKWRPMIMGFQKLYGLNGTQVAVSRLAEIDEEMYRPPPVKKVGDAGERTNVGREKVE